MYVLPIWISKYLVFLENRVDCRLVRFTALQQLVGHLEEAYVILIILKWWSNSIDCINFTQLPEQYSHIFPEGVSLNSLGANSKSSTWLWAIPVDKSTGSKSRVLLSLMSLFHLKLGLLSVGFSSPNKHSAH